MSAVRLSEVQKELASLEDQLTPLLMKYKQEKERLDTIRRLQNKRQELMVALEMAEQRQDLARIAGAHMLQCDWICRRAAATCSPPHLNQDAPAPTLDLMLCMSQGAKP
jgi:hypothetical protein